MRVLGLNGRPYSIKVSDYAVDWERKVSKPQKLVKDFLRPFWSLHVVTEECSIPTGKGRPMRVDLMNWTRRLAVEVSPSSSHSFNRFFHGNKINFGAAVKRDLQKEEWCTLNRFTFIEIGDDDLPKLSAKWFLDTYSITL